MKYYTIYRHEIGLPDYFDQDLGDTEDCYIFDNRKDAQECADYLNAEHSTDAEWNNYGIEYRYYVEGRTA